MHVRPKPWTTPQSGNCLQTTSKTMNIELKDPSHGPIYAQVRERPRYIVQAVLEQDAERPEALGSLPLPKYSEAQPR